MNVQGYSYLWEVRLPGSVVPIIKYSFNSSEKISFFTEKFISGTKHHSFVSFQPQASFNIFSQKTVILVMGIDITELLSTLDQC